MNTLSLLIFFLLLPGLAGATPSPGSHGAQPLSGNDILIVCNNNFTGSRDIAEYYAAKRYVPEKNIICLELPKTETIPRSIFENKIFQPLKKEMQSQLQKGRKPLLLTVYGVPLKIGAPLDVHASEHNEDKRRRDDLKHLSQILCKQLTSITNYTPSQENNELPQDFTTQQLLQYARPIIQNSMGIFSKPQRNSYQPETLKEVQSLLYRLTGLASLAPQQTTDSNNPLLGMRSILTDQLKHYSFRGVVSERRQEVASLSRSVNGILGELTFWEEQVVKNKQPMASGAVDSELSLLIAGEYQINKWLPNPFHGQFDRVPGIEAFRQNTIMIARLDGPSITDVKRMIDDALWAEEHGLTGTFYIDARGLDDKNKNFYGVYDKRLQRLYDLLKNTTLPVVFDNKNDLFQPDSCPEAALYCGWYSLGKYIDAFTWQRGAVGFHVASSEATTLRRSGSQVWTKRMIEDGISATLGPVQEPYLQSFPLPDVFFPLLLSGQMPLIEVYYRSTPYISWRQVLIGDPLYTPFKKRPVLTPTQ